MAIKNRQEIVILGAGSYGTALACHWNAYGKNVTLVPRTKKASDELNEDLENKKYLPSFSLKGINITDDLSVCKDAFCVFIAIPSQSYKEFIPLLLPFLKSGTPLVIASKGLEQKTHSFLSDIIKMHMRNTIAVWSGPQFSVEVAKTLPSAVTLGCLDSDIASSLVTLLSTKTLRIYPTYDLKGVQLTGALKNVIAIACGIARGKNLGENTIAAIMTRGLAEIRRLGIALGAQVETFLGLSSVGDLFLTCTSTQSRNTSIGLKLGQGVSIESLLTGHIPLTEGVFTAEAAYKLSKEYNVYMPIVEGVYKILYEHKDVNIAIHDLLETTTQWENA